MSETKPEFPPVLPPVALHPHLSLELNHRIGALQVDATFELTQPWAVLFGPSGSGKSTILRAIAGLVRPDIAPDRATIIVLRHAGQEQVAVDTSRRIFIPAHKRAIRWSAQRTALFPNMTVRQSLRLANSSRPESEGSVDLAIERFRLSALADAVPSILSGGEQRRVALALAAIAANGRLLLLDEPFTGLDIPLRDELLASLRAWLAETRTPVLSVTHDIGEAFLLNAEVIRLHQGRVIQHGPAAEVLAAERLCLLAQLG